MRKIKKSEEKFALSRWLGVSQNIINKHVSVPHGPENTDQVRWEFPQCLVRKTQSKNFRGGAAGSKHSFPHSSAKSAAMLQKKRIGSLVRSSQGPLSIHVTPFIRWRKSQRARFSGGFSKLIFEYFYLFRTALKYWNV